MKRKFTKYFFEAFPVPDERSRVLFFSTLTFNNLKEAKAELAKCKKHYKKWKDMVKPIGVGSKFKGYTIYKAQYEELGK